MTTFKFLFIQLLCLCLVTGVVHGKGKRKAKSGKRTETDQGDADFHYIASIRVMPNELHRCAGFLISEHHVITTTSCVFTVSNKKLEAYINPRKFDAYGNYYKILNIYMHPNFTFVPLKNDIALLRLEKPVKNSPIPILTNRRDLSMKTEVVSFGWGYEALGSEGYGNFTLHEKKMTIISRALCSLAMEKYIGCEYICGKSDQIIESIRDDVGTPLVLKEGNDNIAVGMLVSANHMRVLITAYVNLYHYRDWILHTIEHDLAKNFPERENSKAELKSSQEGTQDFDEDDLAEESSSKEAEEKFEAEEQRRMSHALSLDYPF